MFKEILIFLLPEEESQHRSALNGVAWEQVVWEIDSRLRQAQKYGGKSKIDIADLMEFVRNEMVDRSLEFSQ